ncbi:hypothetical protein HYU06_06115 [Candidatus Woesearchaeota archaeon]|nr:hypothetical protein [Candidatus Woesearchaeota archaeon]
MKNKTIFLTILLIAALIIAGCEGGSSDQPGGKTTVGAQGKAFIGGEVGLEGVFLTGAPPVEVFDNNYPFDINLKIENKGEFDIKANEAIVEIVGIQPEDFKTTRQALNKTLTEDLVGSRLDSQGNSIAGTITNLEFANLEYNKNITGSYLFPLRANICYGYGTKAVAQLCILSDLTGKTRKTGEEPLCEPTSTNIDVQNSGAPVHVTNFAQSVTGTNKISFSFNIVHKGGKDNRVSEKGSRCDPQPAKKDKIYVTVDVSGLDISCSGLRDSVVAGSKTEGFVKLFGESSGSEERAVYCTLTLPLERTDFKKQVNIGLTYDYKQFVNTEVLVKHIE